jgi:hypothetical protein
VDPTAGKLVQGGTGLTLSTISSYSGATALAIVSSAVPGSFGRAATSPSAVPGTLGQAATSPSTVPASSKQAVSSSSSATVTGHQVLSLLQAAKPGSRLAAKQLLLQRYQDTVNLSKVLPTSSHGVLHYLKTTGLPIASPFRRLDTEKLAAAKMDFMKMEA